ncbi:MAG: Gfo/Idh/MocA family oxidoreductase [Saprospiraceae bacterium]|nr:Gfo/Idh/MocA family oxidoreductase [Saprospiraceae bacterium]
MDPKRRSFMKRAALLASVGAADIQFPFILPNRHKGLPPSDQVNLGLIGCNNRGFHVLLNHLKVEGVNCVALCDCDAKVLKKRSRDLVMAGYAQPVLYEDFRHLLEQKDIDAVIIGTPDHWHCLPTVFACELGKDVYVEKPMANSIEECNVMVKAARKYARVVQVGQQQRSSEVWNQVMQYLASGKLGQIQKTNVWGNFNYGLGPKRQSDSQVPEGVNYDLFLGPASKRPFNDARYHGSWRFFWDYGGGLVTDWGVHLLDMALWAKNIQIPASSVLAAGTQIESAERMRETFDTMTATFNYPGYMVHWENNAGKQIGPFGRHYGVAFVGENGTLVADRSKWEVLPEWDEQKKATKIAPVPATQGANGHVKHPENFIHCVKSREEPVCPVEVGRAVAINAHMANIAVRSGQGFLIWDDQKNRFSNSRMASKLIKPNYRKPWIFPKV